MQRGFVVWLTGLPGSGKSTLARGLESVLEAQKLNVEVLDGDEVRTWLTAGLGFGRKDRDANVRRIGCVAKLLARNGVATIVAAVSPYRDVRREIRLEIGDFVEVYVKCPLEVLTSRDPKGMYEKAIRGEIPNFTGISDPYEEPLDPHLVVETDRQVEAESLGILVARLHELKFLSCSQMTAH